MINTVFNTGQAERKMHNFEDMLRVCIFKFKYNWDGHSPLTEFTYNISYHRNIQMALYEALYERGCRFYIRWFKVGETTLTGQYKVH